MGDESLYDKFQPKRGYTVRCGRVHFSLDRDTRQARTGLTHYQPTVNFREMHPEIHFLISVF